MILEQNKSSSGAECSEGLEPSSVCEGKVPPPRPPSQTLEEAQWLMQGLSDQSRNRSRNPLWPFPWKEQVPHLPSPRLQSGLSSQQPRVQTGPRGAPLCKWA